MHPPVMITAVDAGTPFVEPADIPDFAPALLDALDVPDFDELFLDFDEELFDFEKEIVPVSADEIREIVATTILSARSALKHLAAAGIA